MKTVKLQDIVESLQQKKQFLYETFGVTRIGIFGSFVQGTQKDSSDIDMVVEIEKDKKNLHNFLLLKRLMEKEFGRSVDLGFEHTLKPIVRENIKDKITYV
jgi:predicted nucleotidyltransferase